MSFINIANPKERDKIVKDYVDTLQQYRTKAENQKAIGIERQTQLKEVFKPVVEATQESTNKITEQLQNNNVNKDYWDSNSNEKAIDFYSKLKTNKDKYYSIQKIDGQYKMGHSNVEIDDLSNITIDGKTYQGTPGLWRLIMLNKPVDYSPSDYETYQDILDDTQAIFNPIVLRANDRPKGTAKYVSILKHLESAYEEEPKEGSGLFLPGDINGLLDRLRLLFLESHAGNNLSTLPEIVAIIDELLRKKILSKTEYNALCKDLKC